MILTRERQRPIKLNFRSRIDDQFVRRALWAGVVFTWKPQKNAPGENLKYRRIGIRKA